MAKLTKQEMFDRAYRGLAKQGWRQCTDGHRDHQDPAGTGRGET